MPDVIALFYLQRALGRMVETKGYGSTRIRVLFVVSWAVAEAIALALTFQRDDDFLAAVVYAVGSILLVNVAFFGFAVFLPEPRPQESPSAAEADSNGPRIHRRRVFTRGHLPRLPRLDEDQPPNRRGEDW